MNKTKLTTAIFREIGIIHERMDAILRDKLPAELPASQFKLLNHLLYTSNTNETATELAHNFHVSLSAMSQIIKQLNNKGFVEIQTRSQDARKKTLTITKLGRGIHQQAVAKIDLDIKGFANNFSLADMQQLYKLSHQCRVYFEDHT